MTHIYPEVLWSTVDLGSPGQCRAFAFPDAPFDISRSNVREHGMAGDYTVVMFPMDICSIEYRFDTTKRLNEAGRDDGSSLVVAKTTVLELETPTSTFLLAHCGDDLQVNLTGFAGHRDGLKHLSFSGGERFRVKANTQFEGLGISLRITLIVARGPLAW